MNKFSKYFFEGGFGLERETLRTDSKGRLSQSPHMFDNPHIERDFCENQIEIITSVNHSVKQAVNELEKLDLYVSEALSEHDEYLWKYSNPPHIESEAEIPVANYSDDKVSKYIYRKKLEQKYGKKIMLYSGIHFNFSFSENFIKEIYDGKLSFIAFKNNLYFRIMKQLCRYSWLIVLLTSASPVYDKSLITDGGNGTDFCGYGSMRNSEMGYWNKFTPLLNYSDLKSFSESIQEYVNKGILISPAELYLPVRLKTISGNNNDLSLSDEISHIELRMFDLNPLAKTGIFTDDLKFAHLFILYLLSFPDFEFTPSLQKTAVKNHKTASEYDIENMIINGYPAVEASLGILDDMSYFYKDFKEASYIISMQKDKIIYNKRYCVRIYEQYKKGDENNVRNVWNKFQQGNKYRRISV